MKVICCGPRDLEDYDLVEKAIEASGFKITLLISGGAKGADSLGEKWAKKNKVKIDRKPAEWDNLELLGAEIRERYNTWKKCQEKYVWNAGFIRNSEMVKIADACIAIQIEETSGTQDTIKKCKEKGIPVFIYPPQEAKVEKKEYKYYF
jgi:hypothetical protein